MEYRQLLILHEKLTWKYYYWKLDADLVHTDLPPIEEGKHIPQH